MLAQWTLLQQHSYRHRLGLVTGANVHSMVPVQSPFPRAYAAKQWSRIHSLPLNIKDRPGVCSGGLLPLSWTWGTRTAQFAHHACYKCCQRNWQQDSKDNKVRQCHIHLHECTQAMRICKRHRRGHICRSNAHAKQHALVFTSAMFMRHVPFNTHFQCSNDNTWNR